MTNQEAISVLESINAKTDYFLINDDARAEAIDIAISALQAQDVPETNVGDTVSRQAAINALCRRCDLAAEDDEPCTEKCNDIKTLEKLPSVTPKADPCENAVSRQELLNEYYRLRENWNNADNAVDKCISVLKDLSSVTPKRKTGK